MDHKCIHHFLEIIQHIMSLFDVGARKRPLTKRLIDSTQKIISEYIKQMMFELPGIPNTKEGLIAQWISSYAAKVLFWRQIYTE